jgi:tetratricopeptide (TPR) repeat protein
MAIRPKSRNGRRLAVGAVAPGLVALAAAGALAATARAEPTPVARAEMLLQRVEVERDAARRFALADEAQALCEKAIAESPKDPGPHEVLARALTTVDPDHPEACRPGACERAVAELKRARQLDGGGVDAERIASELGIILSRVGAFAEALTEYDRALRLVESERRPSSFEETAGRAVLYGNSAETLMALGRLDEAVERYRQSEAAASPGDLEWQLAEWGLGVALDRDEQVEKARAAIERALDYDPTMARLSGEGVFFEPAGDKHYYEALGHEVAGDREQALAGWRAFVAAQPASRWARRARAHLEALRRGAPSTAPAAIDLAQAPVRVGEPMALRPVRSPAQLTATLHQHEDDVRLCYARALRQGPRERGELRLGLEVQPSGYLGTRARVLTTTLTSQALVRCIELAASAWRFPSVESHEVETVIVPLELGR